MRSQPTLDECSEEEYDPLSDDLLLAEMVRAIVTYPEKVEVEEYCDATKPNPVKVLVVRVDPQDCGKVIGKQGRMAELLRTFMATIGIHHGYTMTVVIEGNNYTQPRRSSYKKQYPDPDIKYRR